jgi:beta-phosphoglucomutase-like phosphatase (HAD superfamily)
MKKGVVFDFNGTLFEDSDMHEKAWALIAKEHFNKTISQDEFQTFIHGRGNSVVLDYLSDDKLSERDKCILVESKESLYRKFCLEGMDGLRLAPGAETLLDELVELNIPRSIATSSGKSNMEFYIRIFDLYKWFSPDTIIFDKGNLPSKPAPDIFLIAAKAMNLPPQRCIVFEDSTSGIEAAESAGMGTIIQIDASHSESAGSGSHLTIRDFSEFDRRLLFAVNHMAN